MAGTVQYVGCADLPSGLSRKRFFERLGYLETSATLHGIPKTSILHRWRQDSMSPGQADQAGQQGRFGLLAPQVITHRPGPKGYRRNQTALNPAELAQAGGFRATEVVANATAALVQAAEVLAAGAIVFRSPADFAPSAANRDAMRRYFAERAPPERFGPDVIRVWEPHGLWEPAAAARFAGELGLVLSCDPLTNDPLSIDPGFFANLPSDDAYFRVTGLGLSRRRFDEYALEPLLDAAAEYRRAWLVLAHDGKYPDALRLRRYLYGEPERPDDDTGDNPPDNLPDHTDD